MDANAAPGSVRAWLLATRPKTLWAAFAPVAVGAGLAQHDGVFGAIPSLGALAFTGLVQIATNLANDYYDFVQGADTAARVGPVRVTQAGLLAPEQVKRGMAACLALATAVGVMLLTIGGWPMVIVVVASLVCAVAYTGGPFPLGYHGLGDVFAFVFFGLVAVAATYYLNDPSSFPPQGAFLAGAGVGALATAILVTNNLRDIDTDSAAGKRTLAVIFGRRAAVIEYLTLIGVALSVPVVGWWALDWPPLALASFAAFALAVAPIRRVIGFRHPAELVPALGQTARFLAVYGALLAIGLAFG